jgi:hypothetical protein
MKAGNKMLYTCSTSVAKKRSGKMKCYYIVHGYGNDAVVPDKRDLDLYKNGAMTAKGFALNYEVKLRGREAYEWMARVSSEAAHEDVVLVSEEEGAEKSCRIMLAEMMSSMFGGKMDFHYMGEIE